MECRKSAVAAVCAKEGGGKSQDGRLELCGIDGQKSQPRKGLWRQDLGIFCVQPDFFLIAGDSVKSCSMLAYRWTVYKILVQSRKI
ncbi:hypothetical protein PGTUg99_013106 [Puccinia graminis f. sp. tritici]|uniref:Uncharacterized protein n=1 Tax=Puccinia graminis f. sp. tritici TaxID=56615 RepID=A0A5B0RYF5_PUCGR|nr:hypothetical protein PGTUg99_013106 [Puccinia graminis f. sp. tritici]